MNGEHDLGEEEARNRRKLRDALFSYFLWSLPPKTNGAVIVGLADRALAQVEAVRREHQNDSQ